MNLQRRTKNGVQLSILCFIKVLETFFDILVLGGVIYLCKYFIGWMDEEMNGWVDVWVDGWIDRWMGGWMAFHFLPPWLFLIFIYDKNQHALI